MQGLADGYFVIPYTIGAYLSKEISTKAIPTDHPAFEEAEKNVQTTIDKLLSIQGTHSVDYYHKQLGKITWEKCGMARNAEGLTQAIEDIKALRNELRSEEHKSELQSLISNSK